MHTTHIAINVHMVALSSLAYTVMGLMHMYKFNDVSSWKLKSKSASEKWALPTSKLINQIQIQM